MKRITPADRAGPEGFSGRAVPEGARVERFRARLAELRQAEGATQLELGATVAVSNRVIAYYEADDAQPRRNALLTSGTPSQPDR